MAMIKIIAIGKKHEKWVLAGISEFEKRLKKPFDISWQILPHSVYDGEKARVGESERIAKVLRPSDFVILLDECGKNISSPDFSQLLEDKFINSREVVIVVGGAFGVSEEFRASVDFVWSLSKLVLPHQLVRLVLTEQIYRAQEIASGGKYHHE